MKKIFKIMLSCFIALSSSLAMTGDFFNNVKATGGYVIVDDTVESSTEQNYFTYSAATDPAGASGWGTSAANFPGGSAELISQRWTWNADNAEASKHTYSFTFVGTGVELVGIGSTGSTLNTFQINEDVAETVSISTLKEETVLYSKQGLTYGEHTVNVSLPNDGTQTGLQISYAKVHGSQSDTVERTVIPHDEITGSSNKFTYSAIGWDAFGTDPEHVWSNVPSEENPGDIWYEVDFVGNKIEVYAGKNRPMGNVEYFVDGVSEGEYSLYNASNIPSALIATFEGLAEGSHKLKAVAKESKPIDSAKVVVYHSPYPVTDITLTSESYTIAEGAQQQISYTVNPDYATLSDLVYTSGDENVATVNEEGLISTINDGTATITLSSAKFNIEKTVMITVTPVTPGIGGSIVDIDTQYTQDRYQEVNNMGTLSSELTAWKNDKAVSEIVVFAKASKLKNVTVSASDLTNGKNTISSKNVKTSFVQSAKAYNGSYLGYGSKDRPVPADNGTNRSEVSDVLIDANKIDIGFNELQPIWVEVAIPAEAIAGTYTTEITVNADEISEPITFTYTVDVKDVTAPNASEFQNSFDVELWQYPYSSAEYYDVTPFSPEHFDILSEGIELYKAVGGSSITTTIVEEAWAGQTYSKNETHVPSMIKWIKNADGSMTYDYTDFDKWVAFAIEQGLDGNIIAYSIAPWTNSFAYWENDVLKYEGYSVGNDRYNAVWTDFLQNFIEHTMEKGWFDKIHIGIDERGFDVRAFDLIDSVKNIHDIPFKTTGAMDGFVAKADMARRVDVLSVGDNAAAAHAPEFTQLVADREALGLKTSLYSCTEHVPGNFSLSSPVESYWSVINASEETDGFLRWALDAWVADPLRDTTHNAFEAGDCFVVYPTEKDAKKPGYNSSIRMETMINGVRDVNKIRMMVAEIPSLQNDVDNMYAKIATGAYVQRNRWLTDEEVANISSEMDMFRSDLNTLTDRYIEILESGTNKIESVTINEENISLPIGNATQLTATVAPSNVINTKIIWSVSNENIASVSKTGVVSGLRQGTVEVIATSDQDNTKLDTVKVRVTPVAIPESAQVAYYSFDDETGSDSWGTREGTINGATFVEGKSGNALYMENESQNMTFDTTHGIDDNADWSVSYWVKSTTDFNKEISVMMDTNRDFAFSLKMSESRPSGFRVGKGSGDVLTAEYPFEKDNYYHLTWVQDKSKGLMMYVNGELTGSINSWTSSNRTLAPIDIIGGNGFSGYIDELKVFNRVLTKSEIKANTLVSGINLTESKKEIYIDDTYKIETNLVSDEEDKTITYTSSNPEIASVDVYGVVSAHKRGEVVVTVANAASGYSDTVKIKVKKELPIVNTTPVYELEEKYLSDIEKKIGTDRQYLGQPDMVQTSSGRLIAAYPKGHGKGPIIMQNSDDLGETWTENTDLPKSWIGSQETPTMYVLKLADGTERIMLITSCPGWGTDSDGNSTGWNSSYSDDNGETWTEYAHWYTDLSSTDTNDVIVGMASLVQLKDENGSYIQKWMGVYHNYSYENFKTYLTFDENGNEQWSKPEKYLTEYRDIESEYKMCEIGMFRSPDGNRIVGIARSQSHNNYATLIYSDDEGVTWSEPMDLPGSLAGERHKIAYDPISGRLVITFREIKYDINGNGVFENNDWLAGDWVTWVGTYEDLMNQNDGDYTILMEEDFTQNAKSGDTGYAGVVVLEDGTFIMNSYGHFDQEFSESWTGGVTTDLSYIKQAKFKLGNVENDNGLVNRGELSSTIAKVEADDNNKYEENSYKLYLKALEDAKVMLKDMSAQQIQVDEATSELLKAFKNLVLDTDNGDGGETGDGGDTGNGGDTGDTTNVGKYALLMAFAVIIFVVSNKKKRIK